MQTFERDRGPSANHRCPKFRDFIRQFSVVSSRVRKVGCGDAVPQTCAINCAKRSLREGASAACRRNKILAARRENNLRPLLLARGEKIFGGPVSFKVSPLLLHKLPEIGYFVRQTASSLSACNCFRCIKYPHFGHFLAVF